MKSFAVIEFFCCKMLPPQQCPKILAARLKRRRTMAGPRLFLKGGTLWLNSLLTL